MKSDEIECIWTSFQTNSSKPCQESSLSMMGLVMAMTPVKELKEATNKTPVVEKGLESVKEMTEAMGKVPRKLEKTMDELFEKLANNRWPRQ